jgi:hypothetical protein
MTQLNGMQVSDQTPACLQASKLRRSLKFLINLQEAGTWTFMLDWFALSKAAYRGALEAFCTCTAGVYQVFAVCCLHAEIIRYAESGSAMQACCRLLVW